MTFDHYPDLEELLEYGGVPGVEYALVLGQNMASAQNKEWSILHRTPAFEVTGPNGTVGMVLMGKGEPIQNAGPYTVMPFLSVDKEADQLTGLNKE